MCISDCSSDVCSSDLSVTQIRLLHPDKIGQFKASLKSTIGNAHMKEIGAVLLTLLVLPARNLQQILLRHDVDVFGAEPGNGQCDAIAVVAQPLYIEGGISSEAHTSELQSLMRNSYAVFCLKKKK